MMNMNEDFLNMIYYAILRSSDYNLKHKKIFLNYSAIRLCWSKILCINDGTQTLFGYEIQIYNNYKEEPEFYLGFR